jgi:hypothetical protein
LAIFRKTPTNTDRPSKPSKPQLVHYPIHYPNGVPAMLERDIYVITIRDAANRHETRPMSIRLRTLLKLMLRGFGLRCTDIRPARVSQENGSENDRGSSSVVADNT